MSALAKSVSASTDRTFASNPNVLATPADGKRKEQTPVGPLELY
jgi:hypothetical protein